MDSVKSNNKYTMRTLYGIGDILFTNLSGNLGPFTTYKSKYVVGLIVIYRGRRTSAMGLPNSEELATIHEVYRDQLKPLGRVCCKDFQKIKGYIDDAFIKTQRPIMYKAAGGNYYTDAYNYNWESITEMNTMKAHFLSTNSATLLAGGNMPIGFPATVTSNTGAYILKLGLFLPSRQTTSGRNLKVDANNLTYDDMIGIASDALKLDGVDDAFLKLFDLSTIADLVSPKGSASLKLVIKLNHAFTPVQGATVTIQAPGEIARTLIADSNGEVHFENVDPFRYSITISAPGKITTTFEKDVDTGVNAHRDVLLELIPPPPTPPTP